jgi:molybdopterin molybdotransferase
MKQSTPRQFIGFQTALERTLANIKPLEAVEMPLADSIGFISAEKLRARVDSPSADVSMKDGYAVRSGDIEGTLYNTAVQLGLNGVAAAGEKKRLTIGPGTAVRVLTGALLPENADTVVAEEFTQRYDDQVRIEAHAEPGRNILRRGSDVAEDNVLIEAGHELTPGKIGFLAAGGYESIRAYRKPRVALIATGDELVLPGRPLIEGKLYASNMLTLNAWCRRYNFITELNIISDEESMLKEKLLLALNHHDAVITSGGAWTGDRDLMARVLDELGWEKVYHRVRLGPGKAVGFWLCREKPVFILPGGPPSNLVAFLQLALPGLLKLAGYKTPGLQQIITKLAESVEGQADWTQAVFGFLQMEREEIRFHPANGISRLRKLAEAEGLLLIPEGVTIIRAGEKAAVQLLV